MRRGGQGWWWGGVRWGWGCQQQQQQQGASSIRDPPRPEGFSAVLKHMRRKNKWWAAAGCGYKKNGWIGRSAGMMAAPKREVNAMIPGGDREGITGDLRTYSL